MTDEEWLDGAALLGGGRPVKVVRLPSGVQAATTASEPGEEALPVEGALDGRRLLARSMGDEPAPNATSGRDLLRGLRQSSQNDGDRG